MDTKQISRGADFCGATMLMNLLLPNDEWERDQVLRELFKQNVMLCKVMYSDARTSTRCKTDGADRLIIEHERYEMENGWRETEIEVAIVLRAHHASFHVFTTERYQFLSSVFFLQKPSLY